MCRTYGVESPQFIEIGDMIRVNFYRLTFQKTGDKTAINAETGDKTAINAETGDKTAKGAGSEFCGDMHNLR